MNPTKNFNPFLPVLDTWESYFHHPREGMGTVYERLIFHRLFSKIENLAEIESVLEIPVFGMTGISGINSLWWGKHRKNVTIADWDLKRLKYSADIWEKLQFRLNPVYWELQTEIPFKKHSFDLVWNFASLWFIRDIESFASQVKTISKKVIFICVPNYSGIGFLLRKKYARQLQEINLDYISPRLIKEQFSGDGWILREEGIFDIPPWPDIAMKKEDLLKSLKLVLNFINRKQNGIHQASESEILKYFSGDDEDLENRLLKYSFFENLSGLIGKFWGHHRYFIFLRNEKA